MKFGKSVQYPDTFVALLDPNEQDAERKYRRLAYYCYTSDEQDQYYRFWFKEAQAKKLLSKKYMSFWLLEAA